MEMITVCLLLHTSHPLVAGCLALGKEYESSLGFDFIGMSSIFPPTSSLNFSFASYLCSGRPGESHGYDCRQSGQKRSGLGRRREEEGHGMIIQTIDLYRTYYHSANVVYFTVHLIALLITSTALPSGVAMWPRPILETWGSRIT